MLVAAFAAVAACRGGTSGSRGGTGEPARIVPSDSLVASGADGVEIWFTLAREAAGSDGTRCVERGIEIRRGSTRLKVPLLYTGSAPVFLNDSTIRARLWNRCVPGDAYLVNVRNGHPVKEPGRGKP